jgi:curved DNA-binding protein CbpA
MRNYIYFKPLPQTAEELKKQYRELAHKHHPDGGGNEEDMKIVNSEYATLFEKLKNVHVNAQGERYEKATEETPEHFINIINELMRMDNIVIEVIGCFVWVSGDTKPYKEKLKELRFRWHTKKLCWYLAPEDYRRRSRKDYSLDEIRNMYGTSGAMNSNGTIKIDGRAKA